MTSTPSMFLVRALQKILSEKETRKAPQAKLKSACEAAIEDIKANGDSNSGGDGDRVHTEKYFPTLRLACESQVPKIIVTALDCLQKLIAYGHIGEGEVPGSPGRHIVDDVVEIVGNCFVGEATEDAVCLQILKCLLTAVTSPRCEVHETTLLNAVRTCYNIYLASKGPINQTTARATLNQMLNVIYQRMEANPAIAVPDPLKPTAFNHGTSATTVRAAMSEVRAALSASSADTLSTTSTPKQTETKNENESESTLPPPTPNSETPALFLQVSDNVEGNIVGSKVEGVEGENVNRSDSGVVEGEEEVASSAGVAESSGSSHAGGVQNHVVTIASSFTEEDTLLAAQQSDFGPGPNQVQGGETTGAGLPTIESGEPISEKRGSEEGKSESIAVEPARTIRRHSTSAAVTMAAAEKDKLSVERRATLAMAESLEAAAAVRNGADASAVGTVQPGNPYSGEEVPASAFAHRSHYDAFIVFRALCKLSMKDVPDVNGVVDIKSHELRSKILSLELILNVLQNSGPVMQTHEAFITLIKQYLCISLSKNGVSTVPQVFELSLAIFLVLLACFKVYLKAQIEIFFKDIFLLILETSASTLAQKWLVLQAISRICGDPQLLVDIYVNYDCDLGLDNIFNRMINDISRIAQGRQASELGSTQQQELSMKQKGLECLVVALASMAGWMKAAGMAPNDDLTLSMSTSVGAMGSVGGDMHMMNASEPFGLAVSDMATSANTLPLKPDTLEDFESKKRMKEVVEQCIALFNQKPRKGLAMAQDKGICGPTPQDIVHWLKTEDRLSKTMIGELLGDGDKQCIEMMYIYVDSLDFKNMEFVGALRHFLSGFRLPGEAQKIDRLMEKFAEKYCSDNPDYQYFANADTAYVLAFSIIMLTTDLHSTSIKKKMTKDEFVKNNRGINDSKDLPRDYLESIFDEIEKNEIKVKDDRAAKSTFLPAGVLKDENRRRALYSQQMAQSSEAAQALLQDTSNKSAAFTLATRVDHIRPMFAIAWTSCLAAFSVQLKGAQDPHTVLVCLEGFRYAIQISAVFNMDLERDAFVQSLTKFTNLLTGTSTDVQPKDLECFKTLVQIAQQSGNYLQKSWYQVLKCVSQLEAVSADGVLQRTNNFYPVDSGSGSLDGTDEASVRRRASQPLVGPETFTFLSSMMIPGAAAYKESILPPLPTPADRQVIVSDTRTSRDTMRTQLNIPDARELREAEERDKEQTVLLAVDHIFTGSKELSGDAILEFVRWLCAVSLEELQAPGRPRMYSLQKIVEISYYNMDRIRLEWSRIWNVLGEHFNKVGSLPNQEVAMFAVDSLRQLSMKFLERGELAHFHFQKDFLKPFEYTMAHSRYDEIRDIVVRCIAQMVQSQRSNIRSGWKNVFFVFQLASGIEGDSVVTLAFDTTKDIIQHSFELFYDTAFVDAVNCLVEFACNPHHQNISMEAIDYIRLCAKNVHENLKSNRSAGDDDNAWVKGWFPVLFGLHRIMSRCSLDIRTRALSVLFEIIKDYGHTYKYENWEDLFRIIFRIFDDLKLPEQPAERAAWMNTTCNHAIFAVGEVFTQYFAVLAPLLPTFFENLNWCIMQDNEQLARSATQCLQVLVLSNGEHFSKENWDVTCKGIRRMFDSSRPDDLMNFDADLQTQQEAEGVPKEQQKQTLNFHSIIIKCVVQLEMIQAVENVVLQETMKAKTGSKLNLANGLNEEPSDIVQPGMYQFLDGDNMKVLLDCLRESHEFAKAFNGNNKLRTALWKAGFMKQLPNLLKQETTSLHASLGVLFRVYEDPRKGDLWADVESRLSNFTVEIMELFVGLQSEKQREIWSPVLSLIIKKIMAFDDDRFSRHISKCYKPLCQLVGIELKSDIRTLVRDMLLRAGDQFYGTKTVTAASV
eukprot:comp24173_c0_seq3/m.44171 comp24173_c0_seq3/g.44171  ORF comp24173_c0_seq3/g.44171 comp24173_c0_seq3/m.44171 type:complete len:1874 (-) comp24173_c0_seq3:308-5929(-)